MYNSFFVRSGPHVSNPEAMGTSTVLFCYTHGDLWFLKSHLDSVCKRTGRKLYIIEMKIMGNFKTFLHMESFSFNLQKDY